MSALLDDRPVEDGLWQGLDQLSEKLADKIRDFPASSPVLVSGPWGSGKTSLLLSLGKKLTESGAVVCLFEAWRYEGELPLFAALVRSVGDTAAHTMAGKNKGQKDKAERARQRLWRAAVSFSLGAGPGVAALLGGPAAAILTTLFKGLGEAVKTDGTSRSPEQMLDELVKDRTEELWSAFQDLVETVADPEHPLVVLIDDLDRCSPESTVRLLDGVRHIVARADALPIRFVVALDRGVLAKAIARKFDGIDPYEGNRYLEKIFPVVFTLPQPAVEEIEGLVRQLAAQLGLSNTDDANIVRAVFASPIFANARLIKRVLNRYALWLDFERTRTSDDGSPVQESSRLDEGETARRLTLVRWLAACERWPGLRGLLARREPDYWQRLWAHAQGTDGQDRPPDPDAERILREQDLRTWLAHRDDDALQVERAERSLREWGL